MKKITGNIFSHLLYWVGRMFRFFAEHVNGWGYWFRNASIRVQDWGGEGPWVSLYDMNDHD